jgi:hypothetical protein
MHLGRISEDWLHIEFHACWKITWKFSLKIKYFTLIFTFRSDSCKWMHVQLYFQHNMYLHSTKFTLFVNTNTNNSTQIAIKWKINTKSISKAFMNVSREEVGNYWFTKEYNKMNNLIKSSAEASKQTSS